jgi:integrase/recombinase XerD
VLDRLFSHPSFLARVWRCWLRSSLEDFLRHLSDQRFRQSTLRLYTSRLLAFGEFTARQGVGDLTQLPPWVEPYLAQLRAQAPTRQKVRLLVARFLRHFQRQGLLPLPAPAPLSPEATFIESYLQFLRDQRGLSPASLRAKDQTCQAFRAFVTAEGLPGLHALRPDLIHRFIVGQGKRYSRKTLHSRCSDLRGLLSFLARRGVVSADLAAAVVSPRIYQHEQCPRFLTRPQVEAVLAVPDRDTPVGRRDYAMLLLLATYGLRGQEVVRLCLDDIDWRNQHLHVRRRKAGNSTTYPLSLAVGEAIVAYLQHVRPTSPHRQVFLTLVAPFAPLASSNALTFQVKRYLTRAGIRVAHPGAHSFRYACAQRLFEQDLPLKAIGDYLGHRQPSTTHRYTHIALEQLREVAQSDVEELL